MTALTPPDQQNIHPLCSHEPTTTTTPPPTASPLPTPAPASPLLALPPELRLQIYTHLYPTSYECALNLAWTFHPRRQYLATRAPNPGSKLHKRRSAAVQHLTPPLLTCRTLGHEAGAVLYEATTFAIGVSGYRGALFHAEHVEGDGGGKGEVGCLGFLGRVRRLRLLVRVEGRADVAPVLYNLKTLFARLNPTHSTTVHGQPLRALQLEGIEFRFADLRAGGADPVVRLVREFCRTACACGGGGRVGSGGEDRRPDLVGRWPVNVISEEVWREMRACVGSVNVWYVRASCWDE